MLLKSRCYLSPYTLTNQWRKVLLDKVGSRSKVQDRVCNAASFTINQLKLVKVTFRGEIDRSINGISELIDARATYKFFTCEVDGQLYNSSVLFDPLKIDNTYLSS